MSVLLVAITVLHWQPATICQALLNAYAPMDIGLMRTEIFVKVSFVIFIPKKRVRYINPYQFFLTYGRNHLLNLVGRLESNLL